MLRRILYFLLNGLVAILIAISLSGCVYDYYDEDEPEITEDHVYLTLNVGTADSFGTSMLTRAGSYFYEEPDRPNEKLNNIRIYVLKEDGTIEDSRRLNIAASVNSTSVTFELTEGKKRVYLFGNDSALPEEYQSLLRPLARRDPFPEEELASLKLNRDLNAQFYTSAVNIPMCESFNFNLDKEATGRSYFSANVFVTRIAVKYTFISRDNVDALSVRLNNMAQTQYFMPNESVYSPAKYNNPEIINGVPGRNIVSFLTPEASGLSTFEMTLTGKTRIEVTDGNGDKSIAYRFDPVYLMESPAESFNLSVRFDKGATMGEWYSPQTLPNLPLLPRNTHVVVYLGAEKNALKCAVDVVPYRGCILEPFFGLEQKPQ